MGQNGGGKFNDLPQSVGGLVVRLRLRLGGREGGGGFQGGNRKKLCDLCVSAVKQFQVIELFCPQRRRGRGGMAEESSTIYRRTLEG